MIQKTILFFAFLLSMASQGQKQQASPYSFFGIGNNFANKTVQENSMGGVGTALSIPGNLNFSNPAALSGLYITTYSLGFVNTSNTITGENSSQKNSIFSVSYLGMGIPLGNKGGLSVGLRSRSGVGYTLFAEDTANNLIKSQVYDGSGGASSIYLAGGYKVFKGLSIGVEAAFVFGLIDHVVTESQEDVTYDTQETSNASLSGLETKLGLFYTTMLSRTKNLNIGLSITNQSTINITETSVLQNGFFSNDLNIVNQSLSTLTTNGAAITPRSITGALAYGKRSVWQTSVEYSFHKPQYFTGESLSNNTEGVTYVDYSRISFGGYYIPKFNSLTSYFKRVVYRYGFKYENTGMQFADVPIEDIGMSFGLGLPLGKGLTHLNVGCEYGILGKVTETLVEERYFKVRVSMSLGDNKWFKKRRIN